MYVLKFPKRFCLYRKFDETAHILGLLDSPHQVLKLDFSETEEITAAAALALVANVNHIQSKRKNKGCFVFDCKHSPVYKELFLESKLLIALRAVNNSAGNNGVFHIGNRLNFAQHRKAIYRQLDEYESRLKEQIGSRSEKFFSYLRTSISEVLLNIREHAYPDDVGGENPWWYMFGHRDDNHIHFLVYDLGVGIARSYVDHATKERGVFYRELQDSHILQEAWQQGMSRRIGEGRGNGLANVVLGAEDWSESHLLILSGAAKGVLSDGKFTARQSESIIQGTLIEWAFRLPE
ncbi:hypothetical protein I7J22_02245 [Neisseria meningitidis]|uniref:hypothetical protein n=1 Tax=Neisseria meningitidis TaxID=487 RepID=UPI000E581344|nr:hypothetical protein [Neisseria meningitidis]MBH2056316.1 hypothetical protein [Neisseria meningitidis]MBH2061444.1 hypothetical protein [Neisseria meningitidis]MBH2080538.1 hypothetical protein [Neisseria meningitidis]MBH2162131.1 hypothetical protein [Neisseria meningitidis]MBH2281372.1 hypothetical protein [Neisseria meningitidis]